MASPTAKKFALILILISAGLIGNGCEEGSSPQGGGGTLQPADLLPASGEIDPWVKGSGPGDYGEADDQTSLYALINGAAELYIQLGFVEGVLQRYYGGSFGGIAAEVELYIGDHGDSSNVAAIFDEEQLVPPNLTPWQYGDEAGIDETALFHVIIHLREDRFYVRVTVEKGGDENAALITAQQFAMTVANEIE
jgi:hypothetical protein